MNVAWPTPSRGAYLVALVSAIVCGVTDLLVRPTQIAPALIVISTFLLSIAYPRQAWRWALIVGMGVPLAHLIAAEFGFINRYRSANLYLTYLALVPAFIGAYSAYLLRRFASPPPPSDTTS